MSDFMGAPFVPTFGRYVQEILQKANLKKGQVFLELGSGDGRIVREAVKRYGVVGVGVEYHPVLIWYSRLLTKIVSLYCHPAEAKRLKDLTFRRENFFKTDLSQAQVIFLFLMPKTIEKLKDKILQECKKDTLIISHGFKIRGLERYLIDTTERKLFSSYYYKLK